MNKIITDLESKVKLRKNWSGNSSNSLKFTDFKRYKQRQLNTPFGDYDESTHAVTYKKYIKKQYLFHKNFLKDIKRNSLNILLKKNNLIVYFFLISLTFNCLTMPEKHANIIYQHFKFILTRLKQAKKKLANYFIKNSKKKKTSSTSSEINKVIKYKKIFNIIKEKNKKILDRLKTLFKNLSKILVRLDIIHFFKDIFIKYLLILNLVRKILSFIPLSNKSLENPQFLTLFIDKQAKIFSNLETEFTKNLQNKISIKIKKMKNLAIFPTIDNINIKIIKNKKLEHRNIQLKRFRVKGILNKLNKSLNKKIVKSKQFASLKSNTKFKNSKFKRKQKNFKF